MDAEYLKLNVGTALAQGLSEVVMTQPSDSVEFLGRFLVAWADNADKAAAEAARAEELEAKMAAEQAKKGAADTAAAEATAASDATAALLAELQATSDVESIMGKVLTAIKTLAGASSCYVGQKCAGDEEGESFIKYVQAAPGDEYMLDQVLESGKGVTHVVWDDPPPPEEGEEEPPAEGEEGAAPAGPPPLPPLHVANVLRNPAVQYFKVPSLGSYLAMPFKYASSVNQACVDALAAGAEAAAEGEGEAAPAAEGGEGGEGGEGEAAPAAPALPKEELSLFLAVDSLRANAASPGGFADDAVAALRVWADALAGALDRTEESHLRAERAALDTAAEKNKELLAALEASKEAEAKALEDKLAALPEDMNEEDKALETGSHVLSAAQSAVLAMKGQIAELAKYKVAPRAQPLAVLTAACFVLGYKKKDVQMKGAKKTEWSKMRRLFGNDFFTKIQEYDAVGERKVASYATVDKVTAMLEGVTEEAMNASSVAIGSLFKWVSQVLVVRTAAVAKRKKDAEIAAEKAAAEAAAKAEAEAKAAEEAAAAAEAAAAEGEGEAE